MKEVRQIKDLVGQQFGFLTVLDSVDRRTNEGRRVWKCQCVCGNIVEKDTKALTTGDVRSCGCKRKELHNASEKVVKHGMSDTRIHKIWTSMRNRCTNKSNPAYKDYGARGISVCEDWESFEVFYQWAVATGYNDSLTIDRIDVNGNYCPENCRWATRQMQANNKRTSRRVQYNGEVHTVSEWARIKNISKTLIKSRLDAGWTVDEALNIPAVPGGAIRHGT